MQINTYSLGHDFGNAVTKSVLYRGSKEKMLVYPSAITSIDVNQILQRMRGAGQDVAGVKDAFQDDEYCIEFEGNSYAVGSLVYHQDRSFYSSIGDASRYWSLEALLSVLTSSALLISDREYDILLVTGLPIKTHTEETVKKVKARLNGTHTFTLNGKERIAHIKVGKVLMESIGASIASGITQSDNYYGIIDIGGFTSDLCTHQNLRPVSKLCDGRSIGVHQAIKDVSDHFEEKYGFPLYPNKHDSVLRSYLAKDKSLIGLDNVEMVKDIEHWTKESMDSTASAIKTFIAQTWATGNTGKIAADYTRVDLIGGGAYYFHQYLQPLMYNLCVHKRPEHANVIGYAKYADILLQTRKDAA